MLIMRIHSKAFYKQKINVSGEIFGQMWIRDAEGTQVFIGRLLSLTGCVNYNSAKNF